MDLMNSVGDLSPIELCRRSVLYNSTTEPPSVLSPKPPARGKKGGSGRPGGTKIHAVVDALGLPVRFVLAPGHRGDVIYGRDLLDGLKPGHVIADRAYDAKHFHDTILDAGAVPVIPPRPERRHPHLHAPGAPRPGRAYHRVALKEEQQDEKAPKITYRIMDRSRG